MSTYNQQILGRLRSGDEAALEEIYLQYREDFLNWFMSKRGCSEEVATDLYQSSILAFHQNVMSGRLTELRSTLKTYLFSIGRFKLSELKRRNNKNVTFLEEYMYEHVQVPEIEAKKEYEELLNLVVVSLDQLGEPCSTILRLYYYHNLSMEEICDRTHYKNPNTVKNRKYECLKRLQLTVKTALEKLSYG